MNQELVRIMAMDGIEQPGILYTPIVSTNRIVIHVHGLNGNFYENRFIDVLAKTYTDKGYAFLTFNNRGRDFITELLKGEEYSIIGGSLERFQDCILDIQGVVNWVKEKGYQEIILEGHSYGCNKVLYYYHHNKEDIFKKIVLLAPCDIPSECTKFLSEEEYKIAKEEATKLVNEGKEEELIHFSIMANDAIAAGTFYYDFLPGGENDFIKYRSDKIEKNEILNTIDIPVLIIFGDDDDCVLTQPIQDVINYLESNLSNCNIQIIEGADHSYHGKGLELSNVIQENM